MNQSITTNAAGVNALRGAQKALLLAAVAILVCIAALAARPATAAAVPYSFNSFSLTPMTSPSGTTPSVPTTAISGGHTSYRHTLNFSVDNPTNNTGDDPKNINIKYPPGLLANPEATTKCSENDFNANACTAAAKVGAIYLKTRLNGSPGSLVEFVGEVHVLNVPSSTDAAVLGFTFRPKNTFYRIFVFKSEVTGTVGVRSETTGDYGLTLNINSWPEYVTGKLTGTNYFTTLESMDITMMSRVGTTGGSETNPKSNLTGQYFMYNPTNCDPSRPRSLSRRRSQ